MDGKAGVAVVAVVAGDGMAEIYRSTGLGVCFTLRGGDSMNPSTAEILRAIEAAPSDNVIVLPNNKNVIGTANETPALTGKRVTVVPTRSMQAGIAALLAFSPDATLEENSGHMKEAAAAVSAGAVCAATRDVTMDGVDVRRGDYIGLLDEHVVAKAAAPGEALAGLLKERTKDGSVVTVYYGAGVSRKDAVGALAKLKKLLPGVEIELVPGGQPHYEFLVSIE
jgi:dihydroxyacetone kinase-like predicted kinase